MMISASQLFAQVIDDRSLEQLQNQQTTQFVEGEITVILQDTTSPGYFIPFFNKLGYEVTYADTARLSALIQLKQENPEALKFLDNPLIFKADESQMFAGQEFYRVSFSYDLYKKDFKSFMSDYPSLVYRFVSDPSRSANLKTEIGKELDAIDEVSKLPFVQTAAMIGILGDLD